MSPPAFGRDGRQLGTSYLENEIPAGLVDVDLSPSADRLLVCPLKGDVLLGRLTYDFAPK